MNEKGRAMKVSIIFVLSFLAMSCGSEKNENTLSSDVGVSDVSTSPSAEEVEKEWKDYVDAHNACQEKTDCVVIYTECPLNCYEVISKAMETEAIAKTKALKASYEKNGMSCSYTCIPAPSFECVSNHCEFIQK